MTGSASTMRSTRWRVETIDSHFRKNGTPVICATAAACNPQDASIGAGSGSTRIEPSWPGCGETGGGPMARSNATRHRTRFGGPRGLRKPVTVTVGSVAGRSPERGMTQPSHAVRPARVRQDSFGAGTGCRGSPEDTSRSAIREAAKRHEFGAFRTSRLVVWSSARGFDLTDSNRGDHRTTLVMYIM